MEKFEGPYLLGIDVGTTGCKTELMDVQGIPLPGRTGISPDFSQGLLVEHDGEAGWWKATVDTIQEVLSKSKIDPKEVKGLSAVRMRHCRG
jgi:xylulokinase